jgi:hypothetical protein
LLTFSSIWLLERVRIFHYKCYFFTIIIDFFSNPICLMSKFSIIVVEIVRSDT